MKTNVIYILTLLILLMSTNAYAQKQNNQWRFGYGCAIDFNTTPPSFVTGCPIFTGEGSASVADKATGALLFYTDGVTVWNANNQVMPNGTGLLGGDPTLLSSTTAAVIVPKPGSSNLYYIINVHELLSPIGVNYSLVDMNLNGGLGDIVAGQKNIFVIQTGSEKLEVVPASDGTSFWLVTCDGESFYSFKIDNSGIQNTPLVSTFVGGSFSVSGHMKINRQFNKIGIGAGSQMKIFDFDNATGIVSNPIAWNVNLPGGLIYGIEFSPDGKVLYISDLFSIFQYDLTQTTPLAIQNSLYQIASSAATLQLGIDNKIYVNGAGVLNAINCPNNLGAACGYQTNVIANQSGGGGYGLPKWVYYAADTATFKPNSIIYSDSCLANATQFSIQDTSGVLSISWNFGDPTSGAGNTATQLNPTHIFTQPGQFIVSANVSAACGSFVLTDTLNIINCNTECTGQIAAIDSCLQNGTLFQVFSNSTINSIAWNFGDPNSGANNTSTQLNPTHIFSQPGQFIVSANVSAACGSFVLSDTINVINCSFDCIAQIFANDSCLNNNTFFSIVANDTVNSVSWNFGDPNSGISNTSQLLNPTHVFSAAGVFVVRANVNMNCGFFLAELSVTVLNCDSASNEFNEIFVPQVFSPNADNINDILYVRGSVDTFTLNIFNRWGNLVFTTSDKNTGWDGRYNNQELDAGVFVYSLTGVDTKGQIINKKGNITLAK